MTETKAPGRRVTLSVSVRALTQRLNRRLAQDDQAVRSPRGRASRSQWGDYFIVNKRTRGVVDYKLTPKKLEAMARELGVLAEWEELER